MNIIIGSDLDLFKHDINSLLSTHIRIELKDAIIKKKYNKSKLPRVQNNIEYEAHSLLFLLGSREK